MIHKNLSFLIILVLVLISFNGEINTFGQNSNDTSAVTDSSILNLSEEHQLPSLFMVRPFVILLVMIATGPLFYHHFWEKYFHRFR